MSAKDFRTWHGTVLAAVALAERADEATSPTRRKRAVRAGDGRRRPTTSATRRRSPAARTSTHASIDAYEAGATIAPTLRRLGNRRRQPEASRDAIERAVLRLLR